MQKKALNKKLDDFFLTHPWLNEFRNELAYLILKECNSQEAKDLIFHFLEEATFLSQRDYNSAVKEIIKLSENWVEQLAKGIRIFATAMDRDPDSAGSLSYSIKIKLGRSNYQDRIKPINSLNSIVDELKKSGARHCVWVDEFLGTGNTLIGRYRQIKSRLQQAKLENVHIKVAIIVATKEGLKKVHDEGIDITALHELDKGILDNFSQQEASKKYQVLESLCKDYAENYGSESLNILGWGESEAIYGREDGNVPNNVFPVFWWGEYSDGRRRPFLLSRYVG